MSAESSTPPDNAGVHTIKSPHSFAETTARITHALESHGIKIFATIDQKAEAAAVGLDMPPVTLILFGNPKAGTPLMVAQPVSGLDLPLKVLVWESGGVFVAFNTAAYLLERHHLPAALSANIAPAEKLIASAIA